jgi:hypothetical protein
VSKPPVALAAACAALLIGGPAAAQTAFTIQYSAVGVNGQPASLPATMAPPEVTAGAVTRFNLNPAANTNNAFNSTGFTTAASIDTTQYLTFTLAPDPGLMFSIDDISIRLRRSNTGPQTAVLRSSVDGFTTDLATVSPPTANSSPLNATLGAAFDDRATPVEFRVYGFGGTSALGTLRFTDEPAAGGIPAVVVTGSFAPVPEPVTVLGAAAAGLGLGAWTRRRRATAAPTPALADQAAERVAVGVGGSDD